MSVEPATRHCCNHCSAVLDEDRDELARRVHDLIRDAYRPTPAPGSTLRDVAVPLVLDLWRIVAGEKVER